MSKKIPWWLLVPIVVLLICGLPLFSRLWFAPLETTIRRPLPAASPSPGAAAAVSTAPPIPERADPVAEQSRRERLQTEGQQLKQANTALDAARQKALADKKRAERNTQMMAELDAKLLDPSLKVPQTLSEAASLMGQNLADAAKFKQKWGDSSPAAGTPEADEYAREQDGLMGQSAALMKFMTDEKNAALFNQPGNVARFQTASLASALDLQDDQTQAISTALDGYYQQFFTQGLNEEARPEAGFEAWHQQRLALSKQAYTAVTALLTPEQAAAFHNLSPTAGIWMFVVPFGGLPGVTLTH